jgi:hypothetical protein
LISEARRFTTLASGDLLRVSLASESVFKV